MTTPAITTERLTLRPVSPEDAADLADGGTGGLAWVDGGPFDGTRRAAGGLVRAAAVGVYDPAWGMYALIRNEDGKAVGGMGFHGAPTGGRVEIGYDLAEPARGHGYATEALHALTARTLQHPDVATVLAKTEPENKPSRSVLTRSGFRHTAEENGLLVYELTP
ncbi:GNAT family N-acetyltransferase [Streptomyces beijiangensis]|uniref:GNAT family N-acetyltransferase n=1 Tax=Streptomyces beijiangensis TaxID=163361 RepID=UPI0027DC75E3|nr:GNAT family N-acetyltransferase [Streptomyces beijiangensis]